MRSIGKRISARSASGALAASASSRADQRRRAPCATRSAAPPLPIGSPWFATSTSSMYGAVGDVVQVEIEEERRLAQVARDAVERAEILDQRRIPRRLRRARAARRRLRSVTCARDRVLQRERRRVDLFEPHRVRLRRIDDDARGAQHERPRVVERRRSRASPLQQRDALGEQAAELAALPEPRRVGDLRVERVDLRLELALRLHGVLARGVADAHRREAGERLRARRRRERARTARGTPTRRRGGRSWCISSRRMLQESCGKVTAICRG